MDKKTLSEETSFSKNLYTLAATLFVIIAFRYIAADLIAPVLLAGMFAVLLLPIFNLYRKRGFSSTISLIFMIITIVASATVLIMVLQFSFGLIHENISAALAQLNLNGGSQSEEVISPETLFSALEKIMASFSNLFLYLLIIPALAILLVSQIDSFSEGFKEQLGKSGPSLSKYRKFADSINSYIIGRFKVNLATALMIIPSLLLLGVDYAVLWGFLALILGFIPYIGIFIAGAGPFFIMAASSGITGAAILVLTYMIITTITENFIDPLVQGRENRLTTTSLIVGFIFWAWLFGILGTILAAPLTVMLKTIFEDYPETRWIAMLMVGDYSQTPKSTQSFKKVFRGVKNKFFTKT